MIRLILFTQFLICSLFVAAQTPNEIESFEPVSDESQYSGIWILEDTNGYVNPLCSPEEEFCDMTPGGDKLVMSEESNYFTSYIHPEFGASINLQFTYNRKEEIFDCIMVQTNALGYWMEHENQAFTFELYYSEELDKIMMITQDGRIFQFYPATEKDLK